MKARVSPCAIFYVIAAAIACAGLGAGSAAAGPTLDAVRARGHLLCGVGEAITGFSRFQEKGGWSGLGVDFCRALAAAALGSRDAVNFVPLAEGNRFRALTSGDVDVLAHPGAWTLGRDTELGIIFAGTIFFDGQGFLVRRGQAVASVLELSGATVCALTGNSASQAVTDFFRSRQMRFQLVVAERWDDLVQAYVAGSCILLTGDISTLALERSRFADAGEHMLLPELITKEPLGPAVREGDDQWFRIVRWALLALVAAEEMGITSQNIDGFKGSPYQAVRRFLGIEANLGRAMGLEGDWAYQIVKQVGNYGEIFDRNVGPKSPLSLDRGLNSLWTKGGLMYAPPIR